MATNQPAHLLRFSGILWENMVFDAFSGWETETVSGPRPAQGNGTYLVELLSDAGKTVVSVSPDVSFHSPCGLRTGLHVAEVETYVPLHPAARELVFRRVDQELYKAPVAPEPPRLRVGRPLKLAKDRFRVSWSAKHTAPMTYQVLYLPDDGRSFSLAEKITDTIFTADLRSLPGSHRGRLGVLATDGVRSAFERSTAFHVDDKPPRIWIQSPGQDETVPPDQPITLNGHATDVGGQSLPDGGLQWLVDGKVLLKDSRLGMAPALEPGNHTVTLRYAPNGRVVGDRRISIIVAPRSEEQELYARLLRELLERGDAPPRQR